MWAVAKYPPHRATRSSCRWRSSLVARGHCSPWSKLTNTWPVSSLPSLATRLLTSLVTRLPHWLISRAGWRRTSWLSTRWRRRCRTSPTSWNLELRVILGVRYTLYIHKYNMNTNVFLYLGIINYLFFTIKDTDVGYCYFQLLFIVTVIDCYC